MPAALSNTLALGSLGSNPFPDSSPDFFGALEGLLNQSMDAHLKLIRPFEHLKKTDVLLRGKGLPLHLTFSMHQPDRWLPLRCLQQCREEKRLRRRGPSRPDELCSLRRSETAMFRVTREIEFCYGHRLLNYNGKCRHLHGHNGRAVITLAGQELDSRGMLVDFVDIKKTVQQWIDDNLDHNMLLCRDDPILPVLIESRRARLRDGHEPHRREHRPSDLRLHRGRRPAGRRSRALGNRALLLTYVGSR